MPLNQTKYTSGDLNSSTSTRYFALNALLPVYILSSPGQWEWVNLKWFGGFVIHLKFSIN